MERPAALTIVGLFNLGNNREMTVGKIAQLVLAITGSTSGLDLVPHRPDDPRQRCPDITRAREVLGWEPRTALEDGLRETIAWFVANRAP